MEIEVIYTPECERDCIKIKCNECKYGDKCPCPSNSGEWD